MPAARSAPRSVTAIALFALLVACSGSDSGGRAGSGEASTTAGTKDYSGQTLDGAYWLTDQDLTGANFENARIDSSDFDASVLAGANFDGASLVLTSFDGADLEGATFHETVLKSVSFTGADLTGVDLTPAVFDGINLEDARGVTDVMLAQALGVQIGDLPAALSEHGVILEPLWEIEEAVVEVCRGRSLPEAARYAPTKNTFHPLVFEGGENEAPLGWAPSALRYVELVACVKALKPVKFKNCGTYGGIKVFLERTHARYSVYAAKSGELVTQREFLGSKDVYCPSSIQVGAGANNDLVGSIEFRVIKAFLGPLVGRS